MPERLDHVTIALNSGDIIISWDTRQELLARLQHVRSNSSIRATFGAVGATRPVELNIGQRAALLKMLVDWTGDSDDQMPAELLKLRDALADDIADDQ